MNSIIEAREIFGYLNNDYEGIKQISKLVFPNRIEREEVIKNIIVEMESQTMNVQEVK